MGPTGRWGTRGRALVPGPEGMEGEGAVYYKLPDQYVMVRTQVKGGTMLPWYSLEMSGVVGLEEKTSKAEHFKINGEEEGCG